MRKREYESKLNAWKREIEKEQKELYKMEDIAYWRNKKYLELPYDYITKLQTKIFEKRNKIEWMIIMVLIIENYKIAPKARKSNNLQDLYSRTNNSYYD